MKDKSPRQLSAQISYLSPLDQIRHAEAEVTRKLVQARETANKIVEDARSQSIQTLEMARKAGEQEGQSRYKEILKNSEDEATALVAEARKRAKKSRNISRLHMEGLVERIENFIIGLEEGI
jgi:vacuolar-type H+-ATPase subunit H